MNYEEFIELTKNRRDFPTNVGGSWSASGILLSSTYLHNIPWEFRYNLAEEAATVEFGCNFKNNSCVKERENPEPAFFTPAKSLHVNYCCSRCFQTIGNLLILPDDEESLRGISEQYDGKSNGFWKLGIGCSLPTRYRSTMCLSERCGYAIRKYAMKKEDRMKIWRLTNIKQLWRAECQH